MDERLNDKLTNAVKENGFAAGAVNILTENERKFIETFIDTLFFNSKTKHDISSNAPVIEDLIGVSPEMDAIFNKILTNHIVQNVLFQLIGEDYKIWEISARYSLPGDVGLGIHQDAFGQMNLAIKINDNVELSGATTFLPKSHFLFRWSHKISWARPEISNLITKKLNFGKGDFAFFINKTWHGRSKNQSDSIKKIILIGMFPAGAKFYRKIKKDASNSVSKNNKELLKRITLDEGTSEISPDQFLVTPTNNNQKVPFTILLEDSRKFIFKSIRPLLSVFCLELIFKPLQFIYKFIKKSKQQFSV